LPEYAKLFLSREDLRNMAVVLPNVRLLTRVVMKFICCVM